LAKFSLEGSSLRIASSFELVVSLLTVSGDVARIFFLIRSLDGDDSVVDEWVCLFRIIFSGGGKIGLSTTEEYDLE
jgi:hypothetical protein